MCNSWTRSNYELGGIIGYTCQTQAKTHAIVSRTHRSEKQNKKKTRGGAVESEKMVLHELGAGEAALVMCSFQTESDSERKARRSSRGGGGGKS